MNETKDTRKRLNRVEKGGNHGKERNNPSNAAGR